MDQWSDISWLNNEWGQWGIKSWCSAFKLRHHLQIIFHEDIYPVNFSLSIFRWFVKNQSHKVEAVPSIDFLKFGALNSLII